MSVHHPGFLLGTEPGRLLIAKRKVVSSLLLTASGKGCKEARLACRDWSLPWFTCRGAMGMPLEQAKLQEEWSDGSLPTWTPEPPLSPCCMHPLDNPRQGPGDHAAKWPSERAHTRIDRKGTGNAHPLTVQRHSLLSHNASLDRGQILG